MKIFIITLTLLGATTHAATVYQCTDGNNKTTLTDQPCLGDGRKVEMKDYKTNTEAPLEKKTPEEQRELQRLLRDVRRELREAQAEVLAAPRTNRNAHSEEAGQSNAPCIFINSTELRRLKVRRQIKLGMKSSDVRASLGPPRSIHKISNGSDQWVYDGRYLYMENGCLGAWN